jgi:PKD repeat protein
LKWLKKLSAVTAVCIITMTLLNPSICVIEKVSASDNKQVFRLLAVEATFTDIRMQGGQSLIKALLNYVNWGNKTDQYVSFIHLLSRYTREETIDECKPFWTGNSTKANIESEIKNFLASASSNETVIFYYNGDGGDNTLYPDGSITATELDAWLRSGGLPKTYVCVILDSCHSGSFVGDGTGSTFGLNKMVMTSCRSDQLSYEGSFSLGNNETTFNMVRGYFTGVQIAKYDNASWLPLAVIGGIDTAKDLNGDGWLSFTEESAFAKPSTEQFTEHFWGLHHPQNPVSYNGLAIDPSLVRLLFPTASFTYSPATPTANQTVSFNASDSHSNNYEWFHNESKIPYRFEWHPCNITYSWDFGDGNITTVTEPMITHKYTAIGNYSVSLNVTDTRNLSNATTVKINIPEALHDVAVSKVTPYRTIVGNNRTTTSINVTVTNTGDVAETFNLTLYANTTVIGMQTVNLSAGNQTVISFIWNTTDLALGNYTLSAYAEPVPDETDTTDNELSSAVRISITGDINCDGKVDMRDLGYAAKRFGIAASNPIWDSNVDINEDGKVDMHDLGTVAKEFGKAV